MSTGKDFVEYFQTDDITYKVMSLLNDPADLLAATAVSHSWRNFVISNGLCKKLWLKKVPQVDHISIIGRNDNNGVHSMNVVAENPINHEDLLREHGVYSMLLQALGKPSPSDKYVLFAVGASSTYDYQLYSVSNTVYSSAEYEDCGIFWASVGEIDSNVPESLLYKLNTSIGIVTEIDIRPLKASSEPEAPVFSAKSVRFRMGHPKSPIDFMFESAQPVQLGTPKPLPSLENFEWTYTSPEFPMTQEHTLQPFRLPEPVVCVGGVLLIEFMGRAQKDRLDELFYICLGHVRVLGRRLEPALRINYFSPRFPGALQVRLKAQGV